MKKKKKRAYFRPQLEKDIERACLDYLTMLPRVFAWKANTTGIYDPTQEVFRTLKGYAIRGVSDILGFIHPNARMIAMEVKTPQRRNKVTAEQSCFLEKVKSFGGVAGVVTSIDDAIVLMKGH